MTTGLYRFLIMRDRIRSFALTAACSKFDITILLSLELSRFVDLTDRRLQKANPLKGGDAKLPG